MWYSSTLIRHQGARKPQSPLARVRGNHSQGARESQLKLPLSRQLLRVPLGKILERANFCQHQTISLTDSDTPCPSRRS